MTRIISRNLIKGIQLCLMFILISACGTLLDRKSAIPIDSDPRGEKVLLDNEKELGITPFFYNLNYWDDLYVDNKEQDFSCHINWVDSVTLNGIITFIVPPVGALFYAIDLFSGDLFKCNEYLKIISEKNGNEINKKRVYLALPTLSYDYRASNESITKWFASNFDPETSVLIEPDLINATLSRSLIYQGKDNDPNEIKRERIWSFSTSNQVERILYFKTSGREYNAEVYDTAKMEKITPEKKLEPLVIEESPNKLREAILSSIFSLPNSVSLGLVAETEPAYTEDKGITLRKETYEKENIIDKLARLSMLNIDHPELYSTFDYTFKFSPQFVSSSWEYQKRNESFYTKGNMAGLTYDAIFTGHTLIGQFQFALGLGAVLGRIRDEVDSDLSASTVFSMRFSWIFFLSKNFFCNITRGLYDTKSSFLNDIKYINYNSIQIGYYFPELQTILSRIF